MKYQTAARIGAKGADLNGCPSVTLAFLGDSVTHGCFEVYLNADNHMDTVMDIRSAYSTLLRGMIADVFPRAQVNIVNSGISGDRAPCGAARLERDVLRFHPDLTVVCYGLNDCGSGDAGIAAYTQALRTIFKNLQEGGSEVIFMTPNRMNTYVSADLIVPTLRETAAWTASLQNDGVLGRYVEAAKATADEAGVAVCDVYARWEQLAAYGADTTRLLANRMNHPERPLHRLFAEALFEELFFG